MGKQNSKLKPTKFADLRNDVRFTENELQKWYDNFTDDFPDGSVTRDEFRRIYETCFPDGESVKFTDHVFQIYDANADGKIDFKEFMTVVSVTNRGSVEEKLEIVNAIYKLIATSTLPQDEATPQKRVDKIF